MNLGAVEGTERHVDSCPMSETKALQTDAKAVTMELAHKKRKRAGIEMNLTDAGRESLILDCQQELDGLFEFYSEIASLKVPLEEGPFLSFNSAVACMLEESSLSFSSLVEEIYGKMKVREGNADVTLASIRSAVLSVGQRLMYGIANEDVDVLEDESYKCLWCWETRDMKFLPKIQRGCLNVRRLGRKKVRERISALSTTISILLVPTYEICQIDLIKASQRLQKALSLSGIRSMFENLKEKSTAEMAEKEAVLKEKELLKELERNKVNAEREKKRMDKEIQKEKQQTEKELKRLQEEAAKEEKRLQKEKEESMKHLKKLEEQAKKDQQRQEKEAAELKKQLKIQKQATIMERFLKRPKVNEKELPISKSTCKIESAVNSTISLMDHALLQHEGFVLEELRRIQTSRWHEGHLKRFNRWGLRSKPRLNGFQELKLSPEPLDKVAVTEKDLAEKKSSYATSSSLDQKLGESSEAARYSEICHGCTEKAPSSIKKLLQFDKSNRPAYYGTWSRTSVIVGPRHPLRKDPDLDYEFDSDDEWEEEEPGESLSDGDKDKEDDLLDEEEMRDGDEAESEDSFLVPDGYLSEDEGVELGRTDSSMDEESRNITCAYIQSESDELKTFFHQQKYLHSLTEQALRKCHPLIMKSLRHEKPGLTNDGSRPGTAGLEEICLQALCMRPCPGGSAIEIPTDHLPNKDQEQCTPQAKNLSATSLPSAAVTPDSDLLEFVRVIQSSPNSSINKMVESLQLKFSSTSKSQIRNKVREISDFSENRWQVKKEVLDRLGLSSSKSKHSRPKGIAMFFSKRCLPPMEEPVKLPESSPEQFKENEAFHGKEHES
ncbi:hypothetical protein HPP92_024094 [Vanilla planifolia]|uniref:Chromatin assembly factor 1 subunit FAS1 n=1 Tax=Vanilla planifolia TaxID=51239 RepID=A0A835PLS0_VANPL|nr:hypothetical protein HPP92_024094 [Vanilla planifolia]